MFITICIPTFNRGYIIERAIKSVLNQSDDDWELLIVDDGSTDNTKEVVSEYLSEKKVKYFYKDNGGKHTALNVGIENASAYYFLILDSDDFLDVDCVKNMRHILQENDKNNICGVIGKCMNVTTNKMIGEKFTESSCISYIDMHYRNKHSYGDCCECINTSILKEYRWPEISGIKFIPESYVLDKIGVHYDLICTNEIFKYVEYLDDGTTKNVSDFQRKNNIGFLVNYVDKIDNIFKVTSIPIKKKISTWLLYWEGVSQDVQKEGPRVKSIGMLGYIVKFFAPLINIIRGFS